MAPRSRSTRSRYACTATPRGRSPWLALSGTRSRRPESSSRPSRRPRDEPMKLLSCGDRAILVEVADASERRRLDATLRRHPLPGSVEHVPGARTVLVVAGAPVDLPGLAAALRELVLDADEAPDER